MWTCGAITSTYPRASQSSKDPNQALSNTAIMVPCKSRIRYGWWPGNLQEVFLSISLPLTHPTLALPISAAVRASRAELGGPALDQPLQVGRQFHSPAPVSSSKKKKKRHDKNMWNYESTTIINYKKKIHIWTGALESYANMKFFVIKGHLKFFFLTTFSLQ